MIKKSNNSNLFINFSAANFLILLLIQFAVSQPQQREKESIPTNAETLQISVEKFVAPYLQMQDMSGAILTSRNGKVLYEKGFGFADFDSRTPNTPQTRFLIGSLNKQITAAAILLLEEQKKLKTENTVSVFFPDFPNGEQITLRHLLTHRSGLTKYIPYKAAGGQPSSKELLRIIGSLPAEAKPGERYNYSNAGFVLLALIVEKVSGKNFAQFLAENIFKPLEMKNSGVISGGDRKKLARGYVTDIGTKIIPAPALDVFNYEVYSTVEDLDKWQNWLYGGKLLSSTSLEKMTSDYGDRYGYGLSVAKTPRRFGHDGITSGYHGFVSYFPDEKLSIVYLGNIESGVLGELQSKLPAMVFGGNVETPKVRETVKKVKPDNFSDYAGRYEVFPGFYLDVRLENEKLSLRGPLGAFIALTPLSEAKFFYRHLYAKVTFIRDENKTITRLDWTDASGGTYPCKKISSTY